MTSPQNILYNLESKTTDILSILRDHEDGSDVMAVLKSIHMDVLVLSAKQERVEDLLNLIVKLLGEKAKK